MEGVGDGWVMARHTHGSDLSRRAAGSPSISRTQPVSEPHLMRTYCNDPISTFLSRSSLRSGPFEKFQTAENDYFPTWTVSRLPYPLLVLLIFWNQIIQLRRRMFCITYVIRILSKHRMFPSSKHYYFGNIKLRTSL